MSHQPVDEHYTSAPATLADITKDRRRTV